MSPPLTLARRLLPLALALYGGAQAAVNISASFSPTTAPVGAAINYTLNVSSTEAVALSNMALNVTLPGVTSVSGTPVSNTCGFTLNPSGSSVALTQGSLAAAPGVGSSSCQVTVRVTTGMTTGSYTTTVPNAALSTDQGLTNSGPASASFNLVPLNPPTITPVTVDSRVARPYVPGSSTSTILALGGDIGGSSYKVRVNNSNAVDMNVTGASITVPGNAYQVSLSGSGCVASTLTPQVSDAQRPRPNFYAIDLGTLTVPASSSCDLNFNVVPELTTQSLYSNDSSASGLNRSASYQLTGSVNGSGVNATASGITAPPLAFNLLVNSGKVFTAGTATTSIPLTLEVSNVTTTARSFSTNVALPAQLNDSASVTGVSGAGCSVTGAALTRGAGLNWTFSNVSVPANTTCRYSVSVQRGAASSFTPSVLDNAVTTDWRAAPGSLSGSATQATVTVPTTGTGTHTTTGSAYYGPLSSVVTLRNDTSTDMGGVALNVTWDKPWVASLANSSTTCAGGTLSLSGQQLSMTGAAIPAGTSCSVVTAFLPADVTPQTTAYFYANASVATGPAFNPINSTSPLLFPVNVNGGATPFTIATGERTTLYADIINRSVLSHSGETLQLNTGGMVADPNTAAIICRDNGTVIYSAPIPSGQISSGSGSLNIQLPGDLPAPTFNLRAPYSGSYVSEVTCRVSIRASRATAGSVSGSVRLSTTTSATGFSNLGGLNVTIYDSPGYTNTVSFSPTTVRAGQDATFTLTGIVPASGNVTSTWFRRELTLPDGLIFNTASLASQGSYWGTGAAINPTCDASRSCAYNGVSGWFIAPDRRTLVVYSQPYGGDLNLTVTPTKYGDLTTTMLAAQATPLEGGTAAILGDSSATLKVDPSLVIGLSWTPGTVYSEQTATLNVSVFNANPISDTITVPVMLGSTTDTAVTPVLGGTCGGTLNWNSASRVATISGIVLPSNGSCVATLSVKQVRVSSASFNAAQVPAGAARAQTSNTGNQVLVGSTLSVQPIPICLQASGLTLRNINLTSPGTGSLTANFTNTGTQALGSADLTWITPVIGATYRFDSAPSASTLQQAWANRAAQGALAVNNSTVLTATYQNPAGQARGSVITLPLSANSSGGLCSAVSTHTVTTIRAAPSITTEQALCSVDASGTVTCAGFSTQPVTAKPCEVIRYRVTGTNSGDAALRQGALQLTIPDGTLPVAWRNLSADALYRPLGGGAWQLNTGARLPLSGPLELRNRDTGLIPADLLPGTFIQASMDVQVKGVGCVTAR